MDLICRETVASILSHASILLSYGSALPSLTTCIGLLHVGIADDLYRAMPAMSYKRRFSGYQAWLFPTNFGNPPSKSKPNK